MGASRNPLELLLNGYRYTICLHIVKPRLSFFEGNPSPVLKLDVLIAAREHTRTLASNTESNVSL